MPRATRSVPLQQLADRLHSAALHLLRRLRREDAAAALGPARLSALSVVVFGGPLRVSALAGAEQVRLPTMTAIVSALERGGFVMRERDPQDARGVLVRATPAGAALIARGRARRVAALTAALRDLPARDRAALARAVAVLERLGGRPGATGAGRSR